MAKRAKKINRPDDKVAMEMILKAIEGLSDVQLWNFSIMVISCTGKRAQTRGRDDVEAICVAYVDGMNATVGTPPLRDATIN